MTDHLTDDEIDSIAHGIHECAGLILDDIQIGMVDDLIADVRRHRHTIAAVDALHRPDDDERNPWCIPCDVPWPCPTHTALHPDEETP